MNFYVAIDREHCSVHREDSSKVTAIPKGTRLRSQAQAIINNIYNYLAQLENCNAGRSPLWL